ncbi:MAG: ATP-binding cassette domain-containing protein [Oligoflexia bacterium]|nr:ATP-binding cassette domain-containing protein [Oligoflexia bacterium]MBF0366980.1 ATP-binding cassette domain-containing protein [Oligoflexia bacterium]
MDTFNSTSTSAIEANHLVKSFKRKNWRGQIIENITAVNDVSFTINPGETVAFIGTNGSGKSTTLRMLSGIIFPTSGDARICGYKSGSMEAAMRFGLVSGNRSVLWAHMTVQQSLEVIGAAYGLLAVESCKRINLLADQLAITPLLRRRGGHLSLGERMRCEMAAAVLHQPSVLLADEPTLGLDIPSRRDLRNLLREWVINSGISLLLTSHDVGDIESLCSRTILIAKGEVVYDGETSLIEKQSLSHSLEDRLATIMAQGWS